MARPEGGEKGGVDNRPVEYDAIWAEPLRRAGEAGVTVPELENLAAEIRGKLAARPSS